LDRRLGRFQSWSGCGGEEKNPCPYQELNTGCPAHRLVSILRNEVVMTHFKVQSWHLPGEAEETMKNLMVARSLDEI
jgi:hypothetical protein